MSLHCESGAAEPAPPPLSPVHEAMPQAQARGERSLSSASSLAGAALEDDIRAMSEQMQRVLAFCDAQAQSPLRLQARINDLEEQLHQAIAEKNYWMKRCKELSGARPPAPEAKSRDMRTSRSERLLLAGSR